jgi:leucine dehydrogenase|tara:strand:+ start:939 stop:2045 length:1107 start_codon:yes stop_codon:yes gene_type:complete
MSIVIESMDKKGHEQVVFCNDEDTGLKAIIAIHNTTIGPALGGCRMWNYETEEDALTDVLRLSRGMSYKAAIANLNLGGGKAVIIGDSKKDKNEILFRSFGRFVEGLTGRYITAEDVGTSVKDMEWVRMETKYVTGISRALGGSGDPSPVTALGTSVGIKATVKKQLGKDSIHGMKIGVQGVGHVGYYLCQYLAEEGAQLLVTDIDSDALKKVVDEFGAEVIGLEDIYDADIDIYAPCALGATLNDETIPKLKCSIVAGAANNQLKNEQTHAQMLKDRGILYAPDYAINAGGLINVANEIEGYNRDRAFSQAEGIYDTLMTIYLRAEDDNVTTHEAATKVAEKRMLDVAKLKNVYLPQKNVMGKRDNI